MRKKFLTLCKLLRVRFNHFYSWLLRSGLKSCGEDVRFEYPVRLEQPASITIGEGSILYPRAWINPVKEWAGNKYDGQIILGKRSMIGYGVQISAAASVVLEDEVAIGAGAVIVDHIHDHTHVDGPIFFAPISQPKPVRIGKGSFLGVYCVIGPGVQIGEHAVIAANALVTKDVPSYCMAVGNPARNVRFHDPAVKNSPATEMNEEVRA